MEWVSGDTAPNFIIEDLNLLTPELGNPLNRHEFLQNPRQQHRRTLLMKEISQSWSKSSGSIVKDRHRQFPLPTAVRINPTGPSDCSLAPAALTPALKELANRSLSQ
jgi:hypothetical protein